jgi:hypothetical protein
MRALAFPISTLLLVACADHSNTVRQRQAYWREVIQKEVPPGTPLITLQQWAAAKSIHLGDVSEKRTVSGSAEYVSTNDLVCKGWSITLEFRLAPDNTVANEDAKTFGNCL